MNDEQETDVAEAQVPIALCNGELFYTDDAAGYLRGLRLVAIVALIVAPLWLLLFAFLQG